MYLGCGVDLADPMGPHDNGSGSLPSEEATPQKYNICQQFKSKGTYRVLRKERKPFEVLTWTGFA